MAAPWSGGLQVRILGRIHNQQTVNVLHFGTNAVINDAPTLNTILKNLANAVYECITDTLVPAVTEDWTLLEVEAHQIAPVLSDPVLADHTAIAADENGTLPAQGGTAMSQLVQVRTGQGGRKGRGRMFLPPAGEATATNGEWDPAALALVAAFCACMAGKFIGAGATTDYRIGVLSKKDNPTFDAGFREAISLTPEKRIAYMTSRKVGRGS